MATIYLSCLGKEGLRELAIMNLSKKEYARKIACQIPGCRPTFTSPTFNEFVLEIEGKPEKIRFMNMAQGSVEEVRYYLILAAELKFGASSQIISTLEEVSRILDAYWKAMRQSRISSSSDS
jgi:glycine cleavage system pyridoxal-binding protein P